MTGETLLLKKICLNNQKSKINILSTLSFQPHDAKEPKKGKLAKREKVSCGRVLTWVRVASASRSLKLLPTKITSGEVQ